MADPIPHEDNSGGEITCAPARRGPLNAPQLQAQLSLSSDRPGLRRLEDTLQPTETWQQVARIEDLCHTHLARGCVSRTHVRGLSWRRTTLWSMFKRRPGDRSYTGDGGARVCGTFLGSQLATTLVCAHCLEACSSQIQVSRQNREDSHTQHPGLLYFHHRC